MRAAGLRRLVLCDGDTESSGFGVEGPKLKSYTLVCAARPTPQSPKSEKVIALIEGPHDSIVGIVFVRALIMRSQGPCGARLSFKEVLQSTLKLCQRISCKT